MGIHGDVKKSNCGIHHVQFSNLPKADTVTEKQGSHLTNNWVAL